MPLPLFWTCSPLPLLLLSPCCSSYGPRRCALPIRIQHSEATRVLLSLRDASVPNWRAGSDSVGSEQVAPRIGLLGGKPGFTRGEAHDIEISEKRQAPLSPLIPFQHFFVSRPAHIESAIVASAGTSVEPYYATPSSIPHLSPARLNRLKLTPIRINQLHTAAARSLDSPPPSPGLTECCGSSCGKDCVKSLHFEEIKAWGVRWWGEERWKEEWQLYKERRDNARCRVELEGEIDGSDNTVQPKSEGGKDSDRSSDIPGAFAW